MKIIFQNSSLEFKAYKDTNVPIVKSYEVYYTYRPLYDLIGLKDVYARAHATSYLVESGKTYEVKCFNYSKDESKENRVSMAVISSAELVPNETAHPIQVVDNTNESGEWQEITFSFTAEQSGYLTINVPTSGISGQDYYVKEV